MMLDSRGGVFPCHKTVERKDDEPYDPLDGGEHYAGALAYALKHGKLPQLARIMRRLRAFDAQEILDKSGHLVWDSRKEWIENGTTGR